MTPAALECLGRFRRYLSSERRLSAHTDRSYARDLAALVSFCDRLKLNDWSELDNRHLRTFAAHARYIKLRERTSFAFAIVSAAAALRIENGSILEARLALGGAGLVLTVGSGVPVWGVVATAGLADGAVTPAKQATIQQIERT